MRSRVIEEYKRTLRLTERQKAILIGVLLGDAHMEKLYNPQLGRLKIEHSKVQKEYVEWLYEEFKNWVRTKPKERTRMTFGKLFAKYQFCTYGHAILGKFRERFYSGRTKIVPRDIEKDITPLSLAVWYMDDGSIKSKRHKGVFLNTQGFAESDILLLQKILEQNFGIISTTKKDKNGKQIYLGGEAGEKFCKLINPYVIPSMRYKIPLSLRLTELPKE